MVEMKGGEVVLSLAAQLASWRAVLVLVRTWAMCKPWQSEDSHLYSRILAVCLNQSRQTVWESAGGATATESRKVGKGRRYADVDGPGANPEPELGPRGPTLKKQALKGFDGLGLTQDLEMLGKTRAGVEVLRVGHRIYGARFSSMYSKERSEQLSDDSEEMDPAGSPSSIRKVADTARPSSSSPSLVAPVPGWRSFFCLGNGK